MSEMIKHRNWMIPAAVVLAALSILAVPLDYLPVDLVVTNAFQANAPGWLEPIMLGASWLGGTPQLMGLLAVAGVTLAYTKREYALAPLIVASTALLVPIAKEIIARPRPAGDLVDVYMSVAGKSFPSGHALMSMTMLGGIFYLADHISGGVRWLTITIRVIAAASILTIGASRVYLGVHWSSDVLGGYLMGALALAGAVAVFERIAHRHRTRTAMQSAG